MTLNSEAPTRRPQNPPIFDRISIQLDFSTRLNALNSSSLNDTTSRLNDELKTRKHRIEIESACVSGCALTFPNRIPCYVSIPVKCGQNQSYSSTHMRHRKGLYTMANNHIAYNLRCDKMNFQLYYSTASSRFRKLRCLLNLFLITVMKSQIINVFDWISVDWDVKKSTYAALRNGRSHIGSMYNSIGTPVHSCTACIAWKTAAYARHWRSIVVHAGEISVYHRPF